MVSKSWGHSAAAATQDTDPQALERETAFEQFLRREREPLVTSLSSRLPSHEDAQDTAQESLARMLRYRDTEPPESWRLLLYRIAVNLSHDHLRRARSRHAAAHVSYLDALQDAPSVDLPQDEQVTAQQTLEQLWKVITTLPPRTQEIYVLNRIEELSYSQIARHCRISEKAVEKHMHRALTAIRHRLGSGGTPTGAS